MKKRMILLSLVAAILLALTGCIRIGNGRGIGGNTITGTGPMVTRNIDVGDFTALEVTGNFVVVYRVAPDTALTVVMQDNLFVNFESNIRGGNLQVSNRNILTTNIGNRPRLYVYAPSLSAVTFSGAVDVQDWDTIHADSFSINTSGAANITIVVEADSLYVDTSGAANLTLDMDVETLDMDISGAADVELSGFAGSIDIRGAGAFNLSAGELLTDGGRVNVAGASNVYLHSLDNIDITTSGLSRVRQAN